MLSLKPVTTEALPPASAAAVAAEIRKTNRLKLGEANLATLRRKRDEIRDQMRELCRTSREAGASRPSREMNDLESDRLTVEGEIRRARAELRPFRDEYATAVAAVLLPIRRDAARRVLAAIREIKAAAMMLDEVAVEIQRAGGEADRLGLMPSLGPIEALARRFAGKDTE